MKQSEDEEMETKVLYAPTQFYDACDDCDTLPEERWEELRHKLDEEKKTIIEGRERVRVFIFFKFLFYLNLTRIGF
jgi:hypothetical protein